MSIVLDGTNGITTPELDSSGPVAGTTADFSGNVTLGSSVLATPTGSAPSYTCRAWVNFNGTATVAIRASGNVSSITDNGTGDYTVNFATAMPDADYSGIVMSGSPGVVDTLNSIVGGNPTSSAFRFTCRSYTAVSTDPVYVNVAIFR